MKTITYCAQAICFIACMIITCPVAAQLDPCYADPRVGAVGFSIGNKGYVGTGCEYFRDLPIFQKDFWEYDPHSDTWTQKADFGGSARYCAVGFSIGSKGYIGTGKNCDGPIFGLTKDFWEYDPVANTWTRKADFEGAARSSAVGFSIGDKGYIGTGYRIDNLKDFWEYDPVMDTWEKKADFPGTERYAAVGFGIGSKGYVGTGKNSVMSDDIAFLGDFFEYDPASDTWTRKTNFGGMPRASAVGFSIGETGYIGTGSCSIGFTNDFWEYDKVKDAWVRKANFGDNDYDVLPLPKGGTEGSYPTRVAFLKTGEIHVPAGNNTDLSMINVGQNYPNPFSVITTIPYTTVSPDPPLLLITNTLGEVVRVLKLNPGSTSVTWDGRDGNGKLLPPGAYYFGCPVSRLEFRKMVIQR